MAHLSAAPNRFIERNDALNGSAKPFLERSAFNGCAYRSIKVDYG
jgi:hypothetical protein